MKFIIVDDEEVMRDSILRFLEQKGHICKIASSGKEALKILDKECADVVLTDLNMQNMSGIELLKIIRKKYPKIKVIILSAFSDHKNVLAASKYGAYDFCSKSEDLTRFTEIINKMGQK